LGETYAGYFCPELVPGVVDYYRPILLDQTVDNIPRLWQHMYQCENFWGRVGLAPAVLSGIEAALWDLKGKMHGLPVYELLGGRQHQHLDCYATGGPSNYPLQKLTAKIEYYLSLGFHAVKIASGAWPSELSKVRGVSETADFEAHKLSSLRNHFGHDIKLMLDGHMGNRPNGTWDLATALAVMRAVEPYDLFFFEEPLHYTDPWGYSELRGATAVPIAGGECLTALYEWRVFAEQDCFDIAQPDAAFTGGLGEFMHVAALFAGRGRRIATHSWAAGGGFMQNIHCGFAAANTAILEIAPAFGPLHSEIIGDSFIMRDGQVFPPEQPGLGIQLTEATKERFPFVPGSGEFNSVPGKILTD
jgi:galactonate dehydratase